VLDTQLGSLPTWTFSIADTSELNIVSVLSLPVLSSRAIAAPAVPLPADYFALTRLLLVPSVWEEPFGRVAAEAMINGIPPLVSDRGSLPDVLGGDFVSGGGGRVLPVPGWMTPDTTRLPTEQELEPWYEAVCDLWDAADLYASVATRARAIADERYSEAVSRSKHVDYFTSLKPGRSPLGASGA
jgi:glycosyltransferase involved in cell wall biosynthesis